MFTLIGIGVGIAYLFSLVATALPYLFPLHFAIIPGAWVFTTRRRR